MSTQSTHCLRCGARDGSQHAPGCGNPPADYKAWAQFTRALMGWTDIIDGKTRHQLLAAEQVREAAAPQPAPHAVPAHVELAAAAAIAEHLAREKVPRYCCPGYFSYDGNGFHTHCTPPGASDDQG
jgi:hypothetical protein